jgi:hypothetical protein
MPYGRRKAPLDEDKADATVEIDFDAVWREVLQPAVPKDFETRRADELRQPGLIDRLYSEWLFDADIVLADLTFGNPNVYYELGIRQALSKKATVLVACQGTNLPFDVRNQYVINYDYFAAPNLRAFQTKLRESIKNASGQALDSPVHVFLPGLTVGRFADGMSPENEIFKLRQRVGELEDERNKRQSRVSVPISPLDLVRSDPRSVHYLFGGHLMSGSKRPEKIEPGRTGQGSKAGALRCG